MPRPYPGRGMKMAMSRSEIQAMIATIDFLVSVIYEETGEKPWAGSMNGKHTVYFGSALK